LVEGLVSQRLLVFGDCRVTSSSSVGVMGPCSSEEVYCFDAVNDVSSRGCKWIGTQRQWGTLGSHYVSRRQTLGISGKDAGPLYKY